MRFKTQQEALEEALTLVDNVGKQRPGRTLPVGKQWSGLDQPGCGAARRRLRQMRRKAERDAEKGGQR